MAAFLIASLPSHLKSLEAVEYMQKNNFSIRISTNVSLMNFLMLSGGGESRQLEVFEDIEPGKEEVHVFANLTCIFPQEIKVEVDSTENSPSIGNPVPIECVVKEEDGASVVDQVDDYNPRLEIASEAVEPVGPMEIPMVAPENPPMDAEQTEEEMVDGHQEEPEEEMNYSLDQVENDDIMNGNVLLAGDQEFNESNTDVLFDIPLSVAEQGVEAVRAEPALEEVQQQEEVREEPYSLDEMEGEEDDQRMENGDSVAVDDLLQPLDDSLLSLHPPHNDELEEDLLGEEVMDYNKGDDADMKENEEEEEQEHEDENGDDDESDEGEEGSDQEENKDEDANSSDEYDGEEQIQKNKNRVAGTFRLLFICPVKNCTSSFSTFAELKEHMKIHPGKQNFFCDACKKNFSTKDAAMAHIHERQKRKCCACGKTFSRATFLVLHLRCHTGEKPHICKNCGKGFSQSGSLNNHMLTHTGEKPFSCDVCKKPFALKKNLERHEITHTGDKPYKCSQCDYRCRDPSSLVIHNRIHTGEKPYSCGYCEKRFSQRQHLKRHELTHTGQKPYSCKECDAKFTTLTSLNWHRKKNHK